MRPLLVVVLFTTSAFADPPPIESCFDASCIARCEAGTKTACLRAGMLDEARTNPKIEKLVAAWCPKDPAACGIAGELHCKLASGDCDAAGVALFDQGCAANDGDSCARAGRTLLFKKDPKATAMFDKAWALLDEACDAGVANACVALGLDRTSTQFGPTSDPVSELALHRAVPLLSRDCDAGDTVACVLLSTGYELGFVVKKDPAKAAAFKKRACALAPKSTVCKAKPSTADGTPTATGALDKDMIRKPIRDTLRKIQYCYEKALLGSPGLQGTVTVKFFIAPDGTVSSSTGTGMTTEVNDCVAAVVKSLTFPKPKGGGGVQVTYPFTFRPSSP